MLRYTFGALILAIGSILPAELATAQTVGDRTVSGAASVKVRPKPQKLRIQVELRSYGKTAAVALENLKARREAAITKLKTLKADSDSLVFSVPHAVPVIPAMTSSPPPPTITAEPGYGAPATWTPAPVAVPAKPRSSQVPELYLASVKLRADWPLGGDDLNQLAATATAIRQKVAAADLGGVKVAQKLSPEEQEAIEETQMGLTPTSPTDAYVLGPGLAPSTSGRKLTAPMFTFAYVATVSAAERKAAVAKAFKLARQDTADLAEAAGMGLGPIAQLEPLTTFGMLAGLVNASEQNTVYVDGEPSPTVDKNEGEVVSPDADKLDFTVGLSAKFYLVPLESSK